MRFYTDEMELKHGEGYKATFNQLLPVPRHHKAGWTLPWKCGLNQGPIVMMIENYRSGLVWELVRDCPWLAEGLRRGWLSGRDVLP